MLEAARRDGQLLSGYCLNALPSVQRITYLSELWHSVLAGPAVHRLQLCWRSEGDHDCRKTELDRVIPHSAVNFPLSLLANRSRPTGTFAAVIASRSRTYLCNDCVDPRMVHSKLPRSSCQLLPCIFIGLWLAPSLAVPRTGMLESYIGSNMATQHYM